jgi:hypothetical protein
VCRAHLPRKKFVHGPPFSLKLQQKSVSATPKGGAIILRVAKFDVHESGDAKRLFFLLGWR